MSSGTNVSIKLFIPGFYECKKEKKNKKLYPKVLPEHQLNKEKTALA